MVILKPTELGDVTDLQLFHTAYLGQSRSGNGGRQQTRHDALLSQLLQYSSPARTLR